MFTIMRAHHAEFGVKKRRQFDAEATCAVGIDLSVAESTT